ncbi:hypothetical protein [Leptospira haakeii]|uniref:Zinc/iron-chelating domain-containing protein n=1 Tax=Leptospira haakeii TaxID=2023198 RepID=A0ABX4PNS5_9LEPT|nr:hypothetical protein [Leptospira haakeii]PKA17451.1 hypothetical protein CH363_02045 [Leptospira haakeii]PKA21175.1 hypothetical protein CH377_02045 [Leptospira haakeii]
MGLCQPSADVPFSCGACCGLFNLELKPDQFRTLLKDRTETFKKSVDFSKPYTMAEFRKVREEAEKNYVKKDSLTYNCPFLGMLTEEVSGISSETKVRSRIGCMIHPVYTGDPRSQNYSFYGASICQAYDCRNKERNFADEWENVFSEFADDSFSYSSLSSDYRSIDLLEGYLTEKGIPSTDWFTGSRETILQILKIKFEQNISLWNTSFELDMESPPPISWKERLAKWLGLESDDPRL